MVVGWVLSLIIWAPAECICFILISWLVVELIVVLLEFHLPGCGARTNFLWFRPVSQILVIGPDEDRELGATK